MRLTVLRGFPLVVCLAGTSLIRAAAVSGSDGLSVTVSPNGSYSVSLPSPDWVFSGSIGLAVSNLRTDSGVDSAGQIYNQISFDFVNDALRHASVRTYASSRSVLFSVNLPYGGPNSFSFPSLANYPAGLHSIAFAGVFGNPAFAASDEESPWISFDAAFHTAILSPASHFMVASTGVSGGKLSSGISSKITDLPSGFTQQTLLVIDDGINRAFDTWGRMLTGVTGKTRPANDADLTLSRLGYWTDAGSSYYYTTEPGKSYQDTLLDVKAEFDRLGMALGYLQLDSWFYPKGAAANWKTMSGGIYEYRAADPPFSSTLATFQQTLRIPLVTHARWIDPASPYQQQFQMSGNVSIDPRYWDQVAGYLGGAGVVGYEQDWLFSQASTAFNLTDGDAFLDNMAEALGSSHISVQYCSGTARHFLQSARYNNLTTMRTSEDRFNPKRWWSFLYASRLASAVGVWPFTDVFFSSETGNMLLATLSAGPVGVGDKIGAINAGNLRRAARRDGVIVKPDVPVAPIDASFWNDSNNLQAPMVAATYTDFGDLRAWYLFEYAQGADTHANFRLADAGVTTPVYLYDYFRETGGVVQPGDSLDIDATGFSYQIAAPVGPSGIAVLGDAWHFVSLGRKRFAALSDDGVVHITMAFAAGEKPRTLHGYSPAPVIATATAGQVSQPVHNAATGRFSMRVESGRDGTATFNLIPSPAGRDCSPATVCAPWPVAIR
jgi:hypothetical protein